jgi:hypothetical protein
VFQKLEGENNTGGSCGDVVPAVSVGVDTASGDISGRADAVAPDSNSALMTPPAHRKARLAG